MADNSPPNATEKTTQKTTDTTAAGATDSGASAANAGTATAGSRLPTFILMAVVVLMAISTIGYIAVNAVNMSNAQDSTQTGSTGTGEENPVVARIDDREYRLEDIQGFLASLPAQVQQIPMQFIYPSLISQFANLQLATEEAYRQGLDSDPEVLDIMKARQDEVVRDVLLERYVDQAVTEQAIDQAYNEFLLSNPVEAEVKARHILVETAEEATAIIAELDAGADFATLAAEHSTGPSSNQGGDLGYFTRERMVRPFADAAFDLEPGTYTSTPVETEFGFHVILVEDRRESERPTREEMAPQLRDQIAGSKVQAYFAELREGRTIELFDLEGQPLDENALVGDVRE